MPDVTAVVETALQAALLVVFLTLVVATARHPSAQRRDALFLFGALVLHLAVTDAARLGLAPPVVARAGYAVLLAQPFLLLRLVAHFRRVHTLLLALAFGYFAAGAAALALWRLDAMPREVFAALAALIVAAEAIGAFAFLGAARRSRGITSERLRWAAAGTGALALGLAAEGAMFLRGGYAEDVAAAVLAATIGAVAGAYLLAFAPPRSIREAWRAADFRAVLLNLQEDLLDMAPEDVMRRLCRDARLLTTLDEAHILEPLGPASLRIWSEDREPVTIGTARAAELDPATIRPRYVPRRAYSATELLVPGAQGAAGVLWAPLGEEPFLLAGILRIPTLFPEEEVETLRLLGAAGVLALRHAEAVGAEREDLERTRDLERFKSTFLRTVAHELGNPLSPLSIHTGVLRMRLQGADPAIRKSLDVIQRSIDRMTALVQDMGDVAKLQEARLEVEHEPLDLGDVIAESVRSHREAAAERKCQIVGGEGAQLPVLGDRRRLGQVLDNLLSNAIKYSPQGGTISVRSHASGGEAVVEVQDQGMGMTQEQMEALFQAYSRAHTEEEPTISGTGLGLAIAKGLVEAHDGAITAESEGPGRGSLFRIRIPLEGQARARRV